MPCPRQRSTRPGVSTVRLDHHEDPSGLHLVAFGHVHLGDGSARTGVDGVFHLHGLEDDEDLAGLDGVAHRHGHPCHATWHRGDRRTLGHLIRTDWEPLVLDERRGAVGAVDEGVRTDPVDQIPTGDAPRGQRHHVGRGHRAVDLGGTAVHLDGGQGPTGSIEAVGDVDGLFADVEGGPLGRRRVVAETGRDGSLHRRPVAAPGLAGQGGGDRMPPDGVVIGERSRQLLDAVPLEETGIGVAGQEMPGDGACGPEGRGWW